MFKFKALAVALAAAILPGAPSAQGLLSLGSVESGKHWDAVGRLEVAGKAFCTGALIAPDLVLTAAHCLYDVETGARVDVSEMQFLAGWRSGRAAAYRYVRRAVHHPDYDYALPADSKRVRNDLALLQLQHPVRNTVIEPFETDVRPETGDDVGVVSYARDRSDAPSLQELCEVIAKQDGIVVMSCQVDFGSSGSPVFSFETGTPRIVSIVSAKAEADGEPVSLGTTLEGSLDLLVEMLEDSGGLSGIPGTRTESAGSRGETGAKVIRR